MESAERDGKPSEPLLALLAKCREKEFHAYGTGRIFEKRAAKYRFWRTLITYLGIVVPLLIGVTALSFSIDPQIFKRLLFVASLILVGQLSVSTWSVVARWDEKYEQAVTSLRANAVLFNEWKQTADLRPDRIEEKVARLLQEDSRQESTDLAQGISDKERRYANREALFYYKKPCQLCGQVPLSRKASECDMCGNF
ncbi:MAG: mobilome CxxCx(11)CxxC protein [Rhodospirillaceae bacterium]